MTSNIHRLAGLVLALSGAAVIGANVQVMAWGLGCLAGATAPDWLEVPIRFGETRVSLIPHRTFTHWIAAWVAVAIWAAYMCATTVNSLVYAGALGFACSALLHCLMDALTPMGVPILSPLKRKKFS